ncbi:MAG: GntR family transcriptional regulator [Oscillospiraceae bacterium]|jgi:GntR family transcriptional regulator|nr:GntR family transcriptional regulator [Oscillospiraceae bacterium]
MIDPLSRTAIYEQLVEQLETLILKGAVQQGEQLPSVRTLSIKLSVNPNTIQKAYNEMDSRGLIYSVPGKGCFVSMDAKERLIESTREKLPMLDSLLARLKLGRIPKLTVIEHVEMVYQGGVSV